MARAPVSKTGGWGFEVPPLLPRPSLRVELQRFFVELAIFGP